MSDNQSDNSNTGYPSWTSEPRSSVLRVAPAQNMSALDMARIELVNAKTLVSNLELDLSRAYDRLNRAERRADEVSATPSWRTVFVPQFKMSMSELYATCQKTKHSFALVDELVYRVTASGLETTGLGVNDIKK